MRKYRGVFLKNENELAIMREANKIGAIILDAMQAEVREGAPTMLFEDIAQDMCLKYQVRPAFQGYYGFPYALCCSVNEVVVHGFPSREKILRGGDIVSFDFGVVFEGFFSDSARTVAVGQVTPEAARLMRVTEESLMLAIAEARPGNTLNDVSAAVQKHAEAHKLAVIKRFVGHGVGRSLHEKPEIPNFVPALSAPLPLKAGMVLAIEPMLALGTHEVEVLADKWTAVTRDRQLAAHYEHSVAVTAHGPEILSLSPAA
ncbi:type I methionyl aminopeptidase [Desulfovibrio sp. OttesenSCG-928-G11]|nr:type I methionyl aminopeptidase [Desulfovibrio sp. OttesenSCG-928-G11]